MSGFQFAQGNELSPCVVFLFPQWVLDTRPKFGGACIGTILMGICVGCLTVVRQSITHQGLAKGTSEASERSPQNYKLRSVLLHSAVIGIIAVQLTVGYFLMLIAMTYQAELFICVMLGLALGHVFGLLKPTSPHGKTGKLTKDADEPLEPCCAI